MNTLIPHLCVFEQVTSQVTNFHNFRGNLPRLDAVGPLSSGSPHIAVGQGSCLQILTTVLLTYPQEHPYVPMVLPLLYRGISPIRNRPLPQDPLRALGMVLL